MFRLRIYKIDSEDKFTMKESNGSATVASRALEIFVVPNFYFIMIVMLGILRLGGDPSSEMSLGFLQFRVLVYSNNDKHQNCSKPDQE